jgi:hypothetical protein
MTSGPPETGLGGPVFVARGITKDYHMGEVTVPQGQEAGVTRESQRGPALFCAPVTHRRIRRESASDLRADTLRADCY